MSSTAYISRDDAETYFADLYGVPPAAWSAATTDEKTLALRRATRWLDMTFSDRWKGTRTVVASAQGTDWPRSGVVDLDGYEVSDATTPDAVRQACAEAAALDLAGELDSIPTRVESGGIVVEKEISAGSVSKRVRYRGGLAEAATSNRRFPLLERLLRHVLDNDSTARHVIA